jgi:aspartate/methionine/tyrosine aminotransferase
LAAKIRRPGLRPYSQYLNKIKTEKHNVDFNLSGTTPSPEFAKKILDLKNVSIDVAEHRNSPNYASVKNKLAKMGGVNPESVELFAGCSQGIFQIFAALTKAGDTIVIETPTYTPIVDIAKFLGLKILRFTRTEDFEKDFAALKLVLKKAKLAFITNPHAPSGRLWDEKQIARLDSLKKPILVDEIYLPHYFPEKITLISPQAKNLISISGFSKPTGISSLRLSWALGSQKILRDAELMGLNLIVDLPTPSLVIANLVLDKWSEILKSISLVVEQNRKTLLQYKDLLGPSLAHDFIRGNYGTLKMPKTFKSESAFIARLEKESIFLKPGSEFGIKNHFRFQLMTDPQDFKKALQKISLLYKV